MDREDLNEWIASRQAEDRPALHGFVPGLGQNRGAVVAGLGLRYSSGAIEGHNDKIKMLKRQMFGRAGFVADGRYGHRKAPDPAAWRTSGGRRPG
ncbi:transposase [Streptomyces sp. NPDC006465]|uniref:transposase n=1 Tax=Streptomyces sp. NPDC006465 TaxID=3157174 RepID=UPI0033AD2D41